MGYDIVVWSPAIGGLDVDRYDVPEETTISVGNNSFSSIPAISEINSASGINQVIALINRRGKQYDTTFGIFDPDHGNSHFNELDYLDQDGPILGTQIISIQNKINEIRRAEGFDQFSFTSFSSGSTILGSKLAELRRSLGIYGILTQRAYDRFNVVSYSTTTPIPLAAFFYRIDKPYGTLISEDVIDFIESSPNLWTGKRAGALPGPGISLERGRRLIYFNLPDWIISGFSANFRVKRNTARDSSTLENFQFALYSSDTQDVPFAESKAYNLDFLEGTTLVSPSDPIDFPLDVDRLESKAGQHYSFILGTVHELTGTGSAGSVSSQSGCQMFTNYYDFTPLPDYYELTIDFGSFP